MGQKIRRKPKLPLCGVAIIKDLRSIILASQAFSFGDYSSSSSSASSEVSPSNFTEGDPALLLPL